MRLGIDIPNLSKPDGEKKGGERVDETYIQLEVVGTEQLREICNEIDKKIAELNCLADEFKTAASEITVRSVESSES